VTATEHTMRLADQTTTQAVELRRFQTGDWLADTFGHRIALHNSRIRGRTQLNAWTIRGGLPTSPSFPFTMPGTTRQVALKRQTSAIDYARKLASDATGDDRVSLHAADAFRIDTWPSCCTAANVVCAVERGDQI